VSLKAALMLILTNLKTFFQLLMFQMRRQRQRVIQVAGMESTFWRKRELLQMLLRPKGIAR
jgi:hypothetical protein